MINSVTVTNFRNDSIDIELFRPEKTGFLITSIDGISFAEADINTMDVATIDGSQYVSSKMKSRSITLNIAFVGDESVETLRQLCYKYFPSKKKVRLRFNTDNRNLWIDGYVESNKAEIFSENESAAITVICPNPFLRDKGGEVTLRGDATGLFEFPFSNESLTEPLLEFGSIGYQPEKRIMYSGEADSTGVIVTLEFNKAFNPNNFMEYVPRIEIYNNSTYEYGDGTGKMVLHTSSIKSLTNNEIDVYNNSIVGAKIVISSVVGDKYIKLIDRTRTKEYDILGAMNRIESSWLYLIPGENIFVLNAELSISDIYMTIEYDTLYGGV